MEQLITAARQGIPGAMVVWKSATAVHIHSVHCGCIDKGCSDRIKYMSHSRARKLYLKQLEVAKRMEVPVVDLFNITYNNAHMAKPNDGRHYNEQLNVLMHDRFKEMYH